MENSKEAFFGDINFSPTNSQVSERVLTCSDMFDQISEGYRGRLVCVINFLVLIFCLQIQRLLVTNESPSLPILENAFSEKFNFNIFF